DLHPRILAQGFQLVKKEPLEILDKLKIFLTTDRYKNPLSVTVLLKNSTKYILNQLKDALRDDLRPITNTIEDG
ncbi:unnamed protein product, partial [Rotaria sordida]